MLKTLRTLFAALILPTALLAQAPPGGKPMFPGEALDALALNGAKEKGRYEKVEVKGQPFKKAIRLTSVQTGSNPWDYQVNAPVPMAVEAGDVMLAEFWARAVETQGEVGECTSEFGFERLGEPWTKSVDYKFNMGHGWKKFSIPFKAGEALAAEKSQVYFRMGYGPQAFELADFKLTHYGKKLKVEDLPETQITYSGMEADAPWRAEAAARIERVRKGDLVVKAQDASGAALSGAKVTVKMKRHAFGFGSAVVARLLTVPGSDGDRYRQEVERLFNIAVYENDLKWGMWEDGESNTGYWRRQYVDDSLKWMAERDIRVRGHNMVWGAWRWIPGSIRQLKDDKAALSKAIEKRIMDVGGAMKGKLADWDVLNEPHTEHELVDILGKDAMVQWFQWAKKADPQAKLFINDYPGPDSIGHLEGYESWIKFLIDKKAPLEGIGLQGHVGSTPWGIPALLGVLDRFGKYNLPMSITEYDCLVKDPVIEASFTRDFMTAVFSHPAAESFLMWGFWDGAHWKQKAPMFTRDWTLKPSGQAYVDLVFKEWWTDASGATGPDGSYKVRGFQGDYEVTVEAKGKKRTVTAKLGKDGLVLPVTLK